MMVIDFLTRGKLQGIGKYYQHINSKTFFCLNLFEMPGIIQKILSFNALGNRKSRYNMWL